MYSLIKKLHKNNKGDTLAIVLIGMLVVFVLGTVVLKGSSVNYQMKVSNFKSKQNFYYVEMAVDDIYAGIGKEVSTATEKAYTNTVTNIVNISTLVKNDPAKLKFNFQTNFSHYLTTMCGYSNLDNDATRANIVAHLKTFIDTTKYSALNVNVDITPINSGTNKTCVVYDKDSSNHITKIIIKNVKVTSVTNTNKYTSSVTTDFVIDVPNIEFDFSDTTEDDDLTEFYKYAIIANGNPGTQGGLYNITDKPAAVYVTGSGNATVNGNIYAGDYHGKDVNNLQVDKEGIYVNNNCKVTINGANVISRGDVVAQSSSSITLNGESTATNPYAQEPDTLRLWAKNLELDGNSLNLTVNGDAFIKDDLTVNGTNVTASINGSYYGFGFDGTVTDMVNESNSNSNTGFDSSTEASGTAKYEHEKKSAVIVNGNNADVKLTGGTNPTLLLGGRAYIDLTGGLTDGAGATYMTGESISVKGNQSIYLLDNITAKQDPNAAIKLSGNPSPYTSQMASLTYNNFITQCAFTEPVVAKKIDSNVYFYHKSDSPDEQTEYITNGIKEGSLRDTLDTLKKVASSQKNIAFGDNTKVYSVGTALEVRDGVLQADNSNIPNAGIKDEDIEQFGKLITDVDSRYANMMYNINDDRDNAVGETKLKKADADSTKSPYDYYVRHELYLDSGTAIGDTIGANRDFRYTVNAGPSSAPELRPASSTFPNSSFNATPIDRSELKDIIPGIETTTNEEVVLKVGNNVGNGPIVTNTNGKAMQYGMIVCTGDVTVNCNFTGMIICGGDIKIESGYTFNANPDLMKVLRKHNDFVKNLINTGVAPTISIDDSTQLIGGESSFTFDKFLKIENWRKNEE